MTANSNKPEHSLRLVMAQVNLLVGDIEGNAERIISTVREAEQSYQADLVVFPELTLTAYPPEDLLLREGLHRRVEEALERVIAAVDQTAIVLGFPQQTESGCYNAAGFIQHHRMQAVYHKHCLPNYSVFDEKRYFLPGHDPCVVELHGIRLGLTICEDGWEQQPIAQARDAGAEVIININASPFQMQKSDFRIQAMQQRCQESGLPIVYVNEVGGQDELVFDGGSFVLDGNGELVCRAVSFEEALTPVDYVREHSGVRLLSAECATTPGDDESVYRALVLGVRDYVNKNRFPGAVIGLSGGIDSALTLAVAVDALGADRVQVVSMPSRYTAEMSIEDAEEQARIMGVQCDIIPIEKPVGAFAEVLEPMFRGLQKDTTEENIQARCRGILLMAISNKKGRIVLTTGNKSEMAVGYATLYGDMAGGFSVLKDVPKTLVYRLSIYRNTLGRVIPERVIERPPSAELAPDQKDTDSLPAYDILDPILERFVELEQCAEEIIDAGFDADNVRRIVRMVILNEYKRRQAPPGVRVTGRAFGRDRRYPITSGFGKLL